jgi:hypothetical protein
VPLLFSLAKTYGIVGAASVWTLLNLSYLLIESPFLHRHYLQGEMKRWYCIDVGLLLLAALIIPCAGWLLIPANTPLAVSVIELAFIFLLSLATSAMLTPVTRRWVLNKSAILKKLVWRQSTK